MKVFISWSGSGGVSWKVARVLHTYLPSIMDGVETLISDKDIMAGTAWRSELLDMMKEAEFCIVCLERQSLRSPWIAFEVGFVANSLAESSICPYPN